MKRGYPDRIFKIEDSQELEYLALEVFNYQVINNPVYGYFVRSLGIAAGKIKSIEQIPFMPAEFFRNHRVITGGREPETFFESSGTTGTIKSRHYITDLRLYDESLLNCFRIFYGDPADYFIAALMPSYIEKPASSLVYMVRKLMESGADPRSCFFEVGNRNLLKVLKEVMREGKKAMLIGVSFALLEFAERFRADLNGLIVVETGGMKGRRKEITREELHSVLTGRFNISDVHSEYGMTELLSQAWSKGGGIYRCPPWMRVLVREINDPVTVSAEEGKAGGINVADLANINSCAFIATSDIGRLHGDGRFEVLGRYDHSETRGCNLMAE